MPITTVFRKKKPPLSHLQSLYYSFVFWNAPFHLSLALHHAVSTSHSRPSLLSWPPHISLSSFTLPWPPQARRGHSPTCASSCRRRCSRTPRTTPSPVARKFPPPSSTPRESSAQEAPRWRPSCNLTLTRSCRRV